MEKLKVFYNAHQSTDDNDSFSPSASKSRAFIEYIDLTGSSS